MDWRGFPSRETSETSFALFEPLASRLQSERSAVDLPAQKWDVDFGFKSIRKEKNRLCMTDEIERLILS